MNESLVHPGAGMNTTDLLRFREANHEAAGLLIGGAALGAAGLVLLLFGLCCKRCDIREVTVFKASLILCCVLQAVSTPVVAMEVQGTPCYLNHCYTMVVMWSSYRRCVVLLQLLVALEFILTNQSQGSTKTVPAYLSATVVLMINLVCMIFKEFLEASATVGVVGLALNLWILKARCFSAATTKPFNQVLCLAFVSFVATYGPSFVMECMILNGNPYSPRLYETLLCSTNLYLATSMYLCWITCRKAPEEEAPPAIEIRSHYPSQTKF